MSRLLRRTENGDRIRAGYSAIRFNLTNEMHFILMKKHMNHNIKLTYQNGSVQI